MRRLGPFVVLGLLAACATVTTPVKTEHQADVLVPSDMAWPIQSEKLGRVGPDDGPLVVERGIGGTGAPALIQTADRGIGGTGIGGTGIVGVVTGFGSVFVDGMEIAYDPGAPVDIDGRPSSVAGLRAGQLVAIRADGPATAPHARTISVRSAVTGRIEALELGSGTLTVGGQPVSVPQDTLGANHFGLGDWVRVSGLRRPDGVIIASRLDSAPAGGLSAHGRVSRDGDVVRVGTLVVPAPLAAGLVDRQFVVVSGTYEAGHGHVNAVIPDALFPDPAGYFGSDTNRVVVQAFIQVDKGSVAVNGITVRAEPALSDQARHEGVAVVSLERGADGSYTAVSLRFADFRDQLHRHFRRDGGAGTTSQAPQHNARPAVTASAPPGDGDADPAATTRLATASVTGITDTTSTSLGSAASTAETQSGLTAIVTNPVVTPSVTETPAVDETKTVAPTTAVTASSTTIVVTSAPAGVAVTTAPVAVTATPTPAAVVVTPAPVVAAPVTDTPDVPALGPPTVQKNLPASKGDGSSLISNNKGNGAITEPMSGRRRVVIRRVGHSSDVLTLKGSNLTPTINMLTGAVTTETVIGAARANEPVRTVGHASAQVPKGTSTIGTTLGKAAGGHSGKPAGR